jgi:hypothetical protein
MPIVDTVRFIPQETVDKRLGPLGFDESYKSPDSEIVRGAVHVLAADGGFSLVTQEPTGRASVLLWSAHSVVIVQQL